MSGPFKLNGWKAYTKVKDKPIKPSTTKTGVVKEDEKPWKDKDGVWHYPKGYSSQKKYQSRRKRSGKTTKK